MTDALTPIDAVLFDLDDTLYLQHHFLASAWQAVAKAARCYGIAPGPLEESLHEIASEGSDRGAIIDRALARVGADPRLGPVLVSAFRTHVPARLPALPGVVPLLIALSRAVPIGLVTDGDPLIQRVKLRALGLLERFDVTVFSDEAGRQFRKPSAVPFRRALIALGAAPERAVFVGDRPDKDIAGAAAVGMKTIRVLTGEYAACADVVAADFVVADASEALRLLLASCTPKAIKQSQ